MSGTVKKAISLMEMLPESGQNFALEFIRKLVAAWDPDFTKVTPAERNALEKAEKDMKENGTVPHDSINWDWQRQHELLSENHPKGYPLLGLSPCELPVGSNPHLFICRHFLTSLLLSASTFRPHFSNGTDYCLPLRLPLRHPPSTQWPLERYPALPICRRLFFCVLQ